MQEDESNNSSPVTLNFCVSLVITGITFDSHLSPASNLTHDTGFCEAHWLRQTNLTGWVSRPCVNFYLTLTHITNCHNYKQPPPKKNSLCHTGTSSPFIGMTQCYIHPIFVIETALEKEAGYFLLVVHDLLAVWLPILRQNVRWFIWNNGDLWSIRFNETAVVSLLWVKCLNKWMLYLNNRSILYSVHL